MKRTWSVLLALALFACSSYSTHRRAQIAEQTGDWDEAVLYYLELLERGTTGVPTLEIQVLAPIDASFEFAFNTAELVERVRTIDPSVVFNDRWWADDTMTAGGPPVVRTFEYDAPAGIVDDHFVEIAVLSPA